MEFATLSTIVVPLRRVGLAFDFEDRFWPKIGDVLANTDVTGDFAVNEAEAGGLRFCRKLMITRHY